MDKSKIIIAQFYTSKTQAKIAINITTCLSNKPLHFGIQTQGKLVFNIELRHFWKHVNTRQRSQDLRQYTNKAKIVGISFAIFTQQKRI
jgi:hypothetical protein